MSETILGIDPSSSCTGLAVVRGGDLLYSGSWSPSTRVKKLATKTKGVDGDDIPRLTEYFSFLNTWIGMRKSSIDRAVVEELGMTRGAKVARVLSHFYAASVIVCYRHNVPVSKMKAGVARNEVLDVPVSISKEKALGLLREVYSHIEWPTGKDADDIGDAFILAHASALKAP